MRQWFRRIWDFSRPIDQQYYLRAGVLFAVVKYLAEALYIQVRTGIFFSPWDFLNPIFLMRYAKIANQMDFRYDLPLLVLGSLPFLALGVTLSIRRAIDAGKNAWIALLFLVPILNHALILYLCWVKTSQAPKAEMPSLKIVSWSVLLSAMLAVVFTSLNVEVFRLYGVSLFAAAPFILGFLIGLTLEKKSDPWKLIFGTVIASVILSGLLLLSLGIEGLFCLMMALPIALILALIGAVIGYGVAHYSKTRPLQAVSPALFFLLASMVIESKFSEPQKESVLSVIEIAAPPSVVWKNVIAFSDLPEPKEWYFRAGIAYPMRARIDGSGVGAIRRCEFSTGPFIEPITDWDENHRLAFSVAQQPHPMFELSPYGAIDVPHLDGYLRSTSGEFRLIPLENGHTRLEGRTFYELSVYPAAYWRLFSDALIHKIHMHVLEHIKRLSEAVPRGRAP